MAEELQHLLDRIQKEGVERADAEAEKIMANAQAKARSIVAGAEHEAAAIIEKARVEGALFQQRGESALGHAARDIILSVGDAITETLQKIVARRVDGLMDGDGLSGFIKEAIHAYGAAENAANLEIILSEKQKESITDFFMTELTDAMKGGLTISSRHNIISGFRVMQKDSGVQHDFSGEALTAAIGELLSPPLAAIVNKALRGTEPAAAP